MEPKTLELLRLLQAGAHDAQAFDSIRSLLATQRSRLAEADDRATLADISELLEVWAEGAPPTMGAAALIEAAQIAEQHLEQSERAVQLYLASIEREPGDLSALHEVEELLSRQEKDSDRLENVLSQQAAALRIRDDFEPLLTAEVYRKLARLRAARGDQSAAIEAYEQALDVSADPGVLRDLADAYAKRGGDADRTQAADLYCTLGDVMGAPDGAEWLERALDQLPGHDAALDLLESFVSPEQHAERLIKRWQAYVESSDDEASVDKRRMLLARAHARRGAARDALICLGPLIERSDADALELQTECLAILRAEEQRDSSAGKPQPAGKPIKPATLVGFRVPPKDPQPFESAETSEPVSETRARPNAEPAQPAAQAKPAQEAIAATAAKPGSAIVAQPVARSMPASAQAAEQPVAAKQAAASLATQEATPLVKEAAPALKRKPRAQSGETLVGFHLPPELAGDRASDAEAQAEAALEEAAAELAVAKAAGESAERVESSRVVLRANAPAQSVPSARASGAGEARPATTRSGSVSASPSRANARTLMGVAPSGPAAAAAALKAAAAARTPSTPPAARASSMPPAAASAATKAAELRAAALRATVPTGVIEADTVQAHAPALAAAPAKISSRPPLSRRSVAPAAAQPAPAALAPTVPLEQVAADAGAASSDQAPPTSSIAPQSLPMATSLAESPFLSEASGPASNRRWWMASAVALVVLGVVVALIAWPSKTPPPPVPSSRVEAAPAVAAAPPAPIAAAAAPAASTATAAPSSAPTTAIPAPVSTPEPPAAPAAPARRSERHADPEVKAVAKQLKIKGAGLSNKDVLGALDDAIDKIETCYGRVLDKNPRAQGDLTIGFTVDKSGKATHVRKVSATLKDAGAQKCAIDAIGKTRFPKPDKKKPVSVTAPLSFKKG